MLYFAVPIVLIAILELLGRWLALKLNVCNLELYFPLGFLGLMALIYPTLLITINGFAFNTILVIYGLLLFLLLSAAVKDFKIIDRSFDYKKVLFVLTLTLILTAYSYNTTLGDLNGFDSTTYLNLVTGNIANPILNSKDLFFGGSVETSPTYYNGQVFYYFASCLMYVAGKFATLFKTEFYYATGYIWCFQILFNALFASILLEGYSRSRNKLNSLFVLVILFFFFGRVYFNNVYGFFGNSLLTIALAYASLFLLNYFKTEEAKDLHLIFLCLIAGCAFSSSGIYILLLFLFAMFFFDYDKDGIAKQYAFVVFLPLLNAINMERYPFSYVYGIPLALSLFLYFAGDAICIFIKKHKLIRPMLIVCFLLTFGLSRLYSSGIFDFSGLLDNLSQRYDMTINYFYLDQGKVLINIYKVFVLVSLSLYLILNYREKLARFCFILIVVFFNPFSCNVLNHFVNVYYRAYVIIINPFTLFTFYDALLNRFGRKFSVGLSLIFTFFVLVSADVTKPLFYHYSHEPSSNYNKLYKMDKDEMDVIRELKEMFTYYGTKDPYIISGNILTQCMLPQGHYLYGRGYVTSINWSEAERNLYEIFYTPEYLGDKIAEDPDYDNMAAYLRDGKVDYLVVNKCVEFYDKEQDNYYSLMYKVNNECGVYPAYENDTFVIYHFE